MKISRTVLVWAGCALLMLMGAQFSKAAADGWLADYPAALAKAKREGKRVLIDFTGSTWCPPCMMMKKRVFDTQAFKGYALENFVLVEADFPDQFIDPEDTVTARWAKLGEDLGAVNPAYGDGLVFPTLVITDAAGKPLAVHQGPFLSPPEFVAWADEAKKLTGH